MTPQEWSINALSTEFRMDRRKVARQLADVHPVGTKGRANLYRMDQAAAAVFGIAAGPDEPTLNHENIRLKKAQADKVELEVRQLKADLIPAAVVKLAWGNFVTACRSRLISLPTTASPQVIGKEIPQVEFILRDLLFQALDELKEYDPKHFKLVPGQEPDTPDSKTNKPTAKAKNQPVGRRKKGSKPRK